MIFDIRFMQNSDTEGVWCSFDTGFAFTKDKNDDDMKKIEQLFAIVKEAKEKIAATL